MKHYPSFRIQFSMYVVAGLTGNTGGATAAWLLKGGHHVTGVVRSADKGSHWRAKGVKIAVAELHDSDALGRILSDAEGAFLLIPPQYHADHYVEDSRRIADAISNAIAASGVPHVALLSSIGAQWNSGTGLILSLHNAEQSFSKCAKNLTIIRAAYFMENWVPTLGSAKNNGTLPSFLPAGRKIPMVATADIGRMAGESLLNPTRGRRIIELAGPEDYSPTDIAGALAGLLNRPVHVAEAPLSAVVPGFKNLGFTEDVARLFEEMYAGINSGRVAFSGAGSELHRGELTPAHVFEPLLR